LLLRLGGPAREEEKGLPDGFLMEIMALREGLEAAQASGEGVGEYREKAEAERARRMERVRELFGEEDPNLRSVRIELNAWRYLERMIEQAEAGPASGPASGPGGAG